MTDLRTGLVEAMARALYEGMTGMDDWEDEVLYDPEHSEPTRKHAAEILDAALGFLTDKAQVWSFTSRRHPSVAPEVDEFKVRRLVAVLQDEASINALTRGNVDREERPSRDAIDSWASGIFVHELHVPSSEEGIRPRVRPASVADLVDALIVEGVLVSQAEFDASLSGVGGRRYVAKWVQVDPPQIEFLDGWDIDAAWVDAACVALREWLEQAADIEAIAENWEIPYEVRVALSHNWSDEGIAILKQGFTKAVLDALAGFLPQPEGDER